MEGFGDKLNQFKIPLALSLVGLVLMGGGLFSSGIIDTTKGTLGKVTNSSPKPFPKESLVESLPQLKVDLSGAVINPGVYTLDKEARVEDLLKLAGGFSASASAEYIQKQLNLSQKVADGQKIYIPYEVESFVVSASSGGGQVAGEETGGKVGINSASLEKLDTLPGVGPVTAHKIIQNRPYQEIAELLSKKSVSKAVYEKLKELVDIN